MKVLRWPVVFACLSSWISTPVLADVRYAPWLLSQSENAVALQLVTLSSRKQMADLLARLPDAMSDDDALRLAVFRFKREEKLFYVLVAAPFASDAQAEEARADFAWEGFEPMSFWLRPMRPFRSTCTRRRRS